MSHWACTVQCCHFDGKLPMDLGSGTGRINMKSLGLFLFLLHDSWQGLAGGLLLWLMGIPEASDFMSIQWNKNSVSVPRVNEDFLTQLTPNWAHGIKLFFWIWLLVAKYPGDAMWTRSDHDEVITDHSAGKASSSDLIRDDTPGLTRTRNKSHSFHDVTSPFVQTLFTHLFFYSLFILFCNVIYKWFGLYMNFLQCSTKKWTGHLHITVVVCICT